MIRSHFGIDQNPFQPRDLELLDTQKQIFDTLQVHAQQGGLCVVMGEPGTGKSVLKEAIVGHDPKRMITPTVARTLHTYSNTLQILCEAFELEVSGRDTAKERLLIDAAWKLHREGKLIVPIIDDAHLMDVDCLRKIRLLLEDFPRSHNLILFAQTELMRKLQLLVNEDLRSRITYSVTVKPLGPDAVRDFILQQLDCVNLAHNVFTEDALDLIVRHAEGILRRTRNLCVSSMLEAVRDGRKTVDLPQVNRVLLQPHWRSERDVSPTGN